MKETHNEGGGINNENTSKSKKLRKNSSIIWKIRYRSYASLYPIYSSFLTDALSKPRGAGKLGWLISSSTVSSAKWLLDVYGLIAQAAKDREQMEKMLDAKEWDNVPIIKDDMYQPMVRWFKKLMYLYFQKKVVSDEDLWRTIKEWDTLQEVPLSAIDRLGDAWWIGDRLPKKETKLLYPSTERLVVAGIVTKSLCIEMKSKWEVMTEKQLLSAFEAALLPYYFPMGEENMDRIGSLMALFSKILQSPEPIETKDRPSKDLITSFLDWKSLPSIDLFRKFL